MNILQKQQLFSRCLGLLISHIYEQGYAVTFGETWRSPETASIYAAQGKGIKNSLHIRRLAADLNLFKGDILLDKKEDYTPFGAYWKGLSSGHPGLDFCWGGDFTSVDSNHFSIFDMGQK